MVADESRERGFTDFDLATSTRVMFEIALHGEWMRLGEPVIHDRMLVAMTTTSVRHAVSHADGGQPRWPSANDRGHMPRGHLLIGGVANASVAIIAEHARCTWP